MTCNFGMGVGWVGRRLLLVIEWLFFPSRTLKWVLTSLAYILCYNSQSVHLCTYMSRV